MLEGIRRGTSYEALVPPDLFQGKEVLLDIDADFFSYNGAYANWGYLGSPREYAHATTPTQRDREFARLLAALRRTGVRPLVTTFAMSPEYTAGGAGQIEAFARTIAVWSRTGTDLLLRYAHWNGSTGGNTGSGRNVLRGTDARVAFDLFTADRLNGRSGRIVLGSGAACGLAIRLLARNLGLDAAATAAKLERIAADQGHPGCIDLNALASFDEL